MISVRKKIFTADLVFLLLAAAGFAVRAGYTFATWDQPAHPDMGSFVPPHIGLTHPFDTSPREPLFAWWLWLLSSIGVESTGGIRLATSLWFLPTTVVLRRLAERFTGTRGAWIVLFLYAILPAQIQADTAGLRHSMEVFGAVLLLGAVSRPASEWTGLRLPGQAALAFAILVLTRVNYTATGTMLLAYAALRSRRIRPIWAVVPALILLAVHLHNNKTRHGDAFHSVNMHTYWFANLEFAGRPGFPTEEERRLEPHRPSLKFGEWALEHHTPGEFLKETFVGVFRCLWIFFERVYFASGLPAVVGKLLLALYLIGLAMSFFRPSDRPLGFSLCLFVLPYAFVSHVFWAGRFFVPFSPIALMLATRAAQEGERMIRRRMKPGFAPFLTLQDDL